MNILRRGRLGSSVKEDVMKFTTSLEFDKEIFQSDILCDIAHTTMLMEQKIVSIEFGEKVIEELKKIAKVGMDSLNLDPSLDDIHMVIESELIKKLGEDVAGRMHTGRSRNDEVATDLRLSLRKKVLEIVKLLIDMEENMLSLAKEHSETITVGYTHLQQAQPVTFGHQILSHVSAVERDISRFFDAYNRINISPLGCGAMATTGFNIDRKRTMELLGFYELIENSMDGVSSRDFIVETMANISMLGTNLSKICEELILFSTAEFKTVEIADEYTSTSSIMPQKKNPDVAEIARAKLSTLNGNLITVLTIMKALPNTYNRDLQEISPHLWKSTYTIIDCIKMIDGMVSTIKVNKERMKENAEKNYATATELADTLVRECNIAFRMAHGIVGELVRTSIEEKVEIKDIILDVFKANGLHLSKEKIDSALDPYENVKLRDVIGGPAPKEVERAVLSFKNKMELHSKNLNDKMRSIEAVEENLLN
ncbi:argininosuccinate lyase [Methanococcus vannielii SB]|jgi:argininosuccinate lyase|uniref:Argininosuccinate lyase n=1 Tax=Methanococcus vannielii (strain ATCC 35089 / DSM 1224 / JCM 13029 / OCM 148 / SB) TaxID=406327 RepID=ARLY_METVS|nr:argininosuccinate lyase [Methanococcus vannielii]A6URI4.1 RecName: Full=Argininosuccinate lyase; Short=ASAL; AltName: Full=Arginosuccinase [Methanococcus vannielii SB]ABR55106.1 argininosuccinate lyase [Methanococcus vannielii SB]